MGLLDAVQEAKGGSQITSSGVSGSLYSGIQEARGEIQPQIQVMAQEQEVHPQTTFLAKIRSFTSKAKNVFSTMVDEGKRQEQIKREWVRNFPGQAKRKSKGVVSGFGFGISNLLDSATKIYEGKIQNYRKTAEKISNPKAKELFEKAYLPPFIEDKEIYTRSLSKKLKLWSDEVAPDDPTYWDKVAQGSGSMIFFAVSSVLTGGNPLAPVLLESAMESGGVYEDLRSRGVSIDEASKKADLDFAGNMIVNSLLNVFDISNKDISKLKKVIVSAPTEGVQEALQQIMSNVATDRPWHEGVLESLGIGATIGAGASLILPGQKPKQIKVKEEQALPSEKRLVEKLKKEATEPVKPAPKKTKDLENATRQAKPRIIEPVRPSSEGVGAKPTGSPLKEIDLLSEASKYKSAKEFVKAVKASPEKIPTTPEYKKYLSEQESFVKKETDLYKQMSDMRKKYADKTIDQVSKTEISKYENLQKELNKTLSQKTLAKAPEGVIRTDIGDKGLESQLTNIYNQAKGVGGMKFKTIGGAKYGDVKEVSRLTKPGAGKFEIGEVYQWNHPDPKLAEYSKKVIVAGPEVNGKIPTYSFVKGGEPTAMPELTPKNELQIIRNEKMLNQAKGVGGEAGEPIEVYRGGHKYQPSEVGERGVSVTLSEETAKKYAGTKGVGSVEKLYLSPDAKIYKPNIEIKDGYLMFGGKRIDQEAISIKAKKEGYDAVDFTQLHEEIRVLNPSVLSAKGVGGVAKSSIKLSEKLVKENVEWLKKNGREFKSSKADILTGSEEFPFSVRSKANEIKNELDDNIELIKLIPKELDKYFQNYTPFLEARKKYIKPKKKVSKLTLKPSQETDVKGIVKETESIGVTERSFLKETRAGEVKGYKRPTIGKTELKTLLKSNKEFQNNPVLTVVKDKSGVMMLAYTGKKMRFKINPDAMQLNFERLKIGDKILIDEESFKKSGRTQQMRVFRGDQAFASIDRFADLKNLTAQQKQLKTVEFPELLTIAKELMGSTPSVKRPRFRPSMGGYPLGLFKPVGKGEIVLNPEMFKDPQQAAKTFAHEIGHLADYIPQRIMKRGNLIARIASLNKHLKSYFAGFEKQKTIDRLIEERKELTEQRRESFGEENKVLYRKIIETNKRIKELKKNPKLENKPLMDELKALTQMWKPFDESQSPPSFIKYRYSVPELYADAISVLFNDPVLLQKEAPLFYKGFFEFLDGKPEFKKNFFAIQDLLNKGEEAVFQKRDEELNKSFEKGEETFVAKELERSKRKSSLMYQLDLLFNDKNAPVIRKLREAQKAGRDIPADLNPEYALHGLNYTDGKLKNYVADNFQPIFQEAQKVDNGWNELGKILFYERVLNERGELANPQGYDKKTARDQLHVMKKQYSKEDWKVLQSAKSKFRNAVNESIEYAEKHEFYSPEMLEQMKMNPAYATYQVIDYLDTYISSRVYQSVGTLKDIANPTTSTVMKLVSVRKAIERNNVKKTSIGFLQEQFPESIEKARTKWNGKFMEIKDPSESHLGLVVTIEKGKPQGYYVDKDVADSLNSAPNKTIQSFAAVSRTISQSSFYRPLFTSFNLGFQTFNFVRDFNRYWKNIPDTSVGQALSSFPRAIGRYAQATPHAAKRALNLKDDLIKEMENSKILGLTYNDMFASKDIDNNQKQIERVLERSGVIEPKIKSKFLKPFRAVLSAIETTGNFIETLPKVAGYIELKGKMPKAEMAEFIRTSVGSPDFRIGGTATPISNNIFLFSNAIKEGMKSDARIAFTKNKSRAGFWWKTVASNFLPKFLMGAMLAGLFGDELKKQMEKVSEYDKTNYTILPLGLDENNNAVYIRMPQDETGRFLGGFLWKLINLSKGKNGVQDVFDVFSFGAGQFPNLSPSFTGAGALLQYLSGKNPYDSFRGRSIIPDKEFNAGLKYSFPIFMKWLAKNQGAGIFFPTDYNYYNKAETDLQKVLKAPVLSNILGRWIKVSSYGETEKLKEVTSKEKQKQAERLLKERDFIDKAIKDYISDPSKQSQIEDKLLRDVTRDMEEGSSKTTKETNTLKKFRIGTLRGESDTFTDAVISASNNAEKLSVLEEIKKTQTSEEFNGLIDMLVEYKVISGNVADKAREIKVKSEKQSFNIFEAFKVRPAYAAETLLSPLSSEYLERQDRIDKIFKEQLDLLATETKEQFAKRQKRLAEKLKRVDPKLYRDKIGIAGEENIHGKSITNWPDFEKKILYKDVDDNFGSQSTNAKRVLKGENAELKTGKEVDIYNRINPDTGLWDENAPIKKFKNPFNGKTELSLDRGLFRINNETFLTYLSGKKERQEMFEAGIIPEPHLNWEGLRGEDGEKKRQEYWDLMLDSEKNTKMAKLIYKKSGWCAWYAAPKDLVKHCSWFERVHGNN